MRSTFILMLVLFVACQRDSGNEIRVADIVEQDVIGTLGVPLGNVVEIDAIIVSGDSLRRKEFASQYLLQVRAVNGKHLREQPLLRFNAQHFESVEIANDLHSLYDLRFGKNAGSLTQKVIDDMELGYVGSEIKCVAYETGTFSGVPENLPGDYPFWAERTFGFETSLVILRTNVGYGLQDHGMNAEPSS